MHQECHRNTTGTPQKWHGNAPVMPYQCHHDTTGPCQTAAIPQHSRSKFAEFRRVPAENSQSSRRSSAVISQTPSHPSFPRRREPTAPEAPCSVIRAKAGTHGPRAPCFVIPAEAGTHGPRSPVFRHSRGGGNPRPPKPRVPSFPRRREPTAPEAPCSVIPAKAGTHGPRSPVFRHSRGGGNPRPPKPRVPSFPRRREPTAPEGTKQRPPRKGASHPLPLEGGRPAPAKAGARMEMKTYNNAPCPGLTCRTPCAFNTTTRSSGGRLLGVTLNRACGSTSPAPISRRKTSNPPNSTITPGRE